MTQQTAKVWDGRIAATVGAVKALAAMVAVLVLGLILVAPAAAAVGLGGLACVVGAAAGSARRFVGRTARRVEILAGVVACWAEGEATAVAPTAVEGLGVLVLDVAQPRHGRAVLEVAEPIPAAVLVAAVVDPTTAQTDGVPATVEAAPMPAADVTVVDPECVWGDEGGMLYGPADERSADVIPFAAVQEPAAAVDYGSMSAKELTALLASRGLLSSRATKAALVKRLVVADRAAAAVSLAG